MEQKRKLNMNKFLFLILSLVVLLQSNISNATTLPYDFSDTERVLIKLSILEEISTKTPHLEGEDIKFKAIEDVFYKDKYILNKGDIVTAKLETIITSGMNGFPAEIIVDDFIIPNVKPSQLVSTYTKKGQNRCLWVYPLKWSLTLIPFAGSLTNFIKGGHARLKPKDIVTLYYYPNWK